jgi:hypothetical protein
MCLAMRLSRGLKKDGLKNLKLGKLVGPFLTDARWSCSQLPGRVVGGYGINSPRNRKLSCTYVKCEAECVIDATPAYTL